MAWDKRPALVQYLGEDMDGLTHGRQYEAFFLEYWQGERNSLHVRDDSGAITDFHPFEAFEVLSDPDGVLAPYEADVRCVTHQHEDGFGGLLYGEVYKAIGRDRDGMYLVMDRSGDCYFYPADDFEVVHDPHGILSQRSLYFNLYGQDVR